ncbi:MAG: flagellar basal body P-ring protein FlgI, partial [Planctomycetaceae bacterium]|nr:flagellar basal body P-ring protein FlgI [Planctomycetaceae bacterium]
MNTQIQPARRRAARSLLAVLLVAASASPLAVADGTITRIKDITTVEGDRINQLSGMGLVVGLAGTGGKTPTTRLFALNMLQRYGQRFDPALRAALRNDAKDRTDNMSAVMVLAELPADGTLGQKIDVTVSAVDDAKSLLGGVLVFTPL